MSLLVVGTVAFDTIETPFGKRDRVVGGAATYISLAASYFAKKVNVVSVIGGDFPKATLEMMNDKGIDTSGIEVKEKEMSFFWEGKYHYDMNSRDTITTELNVLADFDPKVPVAYQDCEYLLLGNLSPQVQSSVLDQLPQKPRIVVLDTMNFWMDTAKDELMQIIGKVDVLAINDEEARQLSGELSLVKAAQKVLSYGPKYLIIKKGEHGALLFESENVFFAPALPLEDVVDPTGAGDSFAGGFIGYLAQSGNISFENMKRAIIYGSAMASFSVEKFGTKKLENLSREDIDKRIQEFVDLVQFDISLVS